MIKSLKSFFYRDIDVYWKNRIKESFINLNMTQKYFTLKICLTAIALRLKLNFYFGI